MYAPFTFFLLSNVHFWNYHISLHTYVRKLLQTICLYFPSHPWLTLLIAIFCGQDNRTRGKAQFPSALSSIQPSHPRNISPPTSYVYPSKVISMPRRTAFWHSSSLRATGGNFPLHCAKYFLRALTLFLLWYYYGGRGGGGGGGGGGLFNGISMVYYMRNNTVRGQWGSIEEE